jgi:acyl-CoA thioester hydrolase
VKDYPAAASFRVEYGDTDGQGRVFYANYLRFFDRGRLAYWERAGLSEEEVRQIEHDTVIAEVHCTYRSPASFYDTVSVHTRVAHIGRSSLRMEFAVMNDSTATLMAEGFATLVKVDLAANRAVPFEAEFKTKLGALEGHALEG